MLGRHHGHVPGCALVLRGGRRHVSPCSAQHFFVAAVTTLLWAAGVMTFALAHAAAACSAGAGGSAPSVRATFAAASLALWLLKSLTAPWLSATASAVAHGTCSRCIHERACRA